MINKYSVLSIDCDWILSLKHQYELFKYLIPVLNKYKTIKFSYNHHDINKYFNFQNVSTFESCDIFNVDNHHDAGYEEKRQTLDEGNWLYHLINAFPNKINYTWVANVESEPIGNEPFKSVFNKFIKSYHFTYDLDVLKDKKFDIIFICCSPEYNNQLGIVSYKILENIYGS